VAAASVTAAEAAHVAAAHVAATEAAHVAATEAAHVGGTAEAAHVTATQAPVEASGVHGWRESTSRAAELTGHSTTIAAQGVLLWQRTTVLGRDSSRRPQTLVQVRTSVEVCRPGEMVWTASQAVIDSGAGPDAPAWQAAIVERIATRTVEVRGVISHRVGVERIEVCAVLMDAAEL
jgi:hypothetical protein